MLVTGYQFLRPNHLSITSYHAGGGCQNMNLYLIAE